MIHQRTLQALEFPKVVRLFAACCLSAQGREEAEALTPYTACEDAQAALALYADASVWLCDPEVQQHAQFVAFPDIRPLLAAISQAAPLPKDTDSFWALRTVLNCAERAHAAILLPQGSRAWPHLQALAEATELPTQTRLALNRCLSDDALIKDESSPELFRIRNEIRSLHQHCLGRVREFATKYNILSYLQDEFMTISQDRYVLPIKATYKGRLQGILHDWSQTGETCYFEPMFLVTLNNKLQELRREEREEELRVLDYLANLVRTEFQRVQAAVSLLTQIDLLQAKKKLADQLSAIPLAITSEAEGLELNAARHPLLVAQEGQTVHPLDICLRPGDRVLLLSGGNAGGKTVCLKTLGLVYSMTASGLPAPVAPGSHIFWLERLDAFIGDEQDVEDHVSTFTAQIEHLAKAWKYLKDQSMVLLDEFGAGTDPTQGAALAQAVLESLLERKSYVVAATHFPTLKIWALAAEHVRAASMLFDPKSKRPLYQLAYDQVGQSQTLTVAKDHGLAPEILEKAEHILLLGGNDVADHVERLNALTVAREEERQKLLRLQKKTESDAKNLKEKLIKERDEVLGRLNKTIADLMHKVKADKVSAKEALAQLKAERAALQETLPKEESTPCPTPELGVGRNVYHKKIKKKGVITAIDERRNRVHVDFGGISLWATIQDLEGIGGVGGGSTGTQSSSAPVHHNAELGFTPHVDVRGMTAEEAISAIDRFLDNTLLSGLSQVEIIHGRGTGVLRKAVHTYLRTYPGIASVQLANEDQGGDGKTIVTFG